MTDDSTVSAPAERPRDGSRPRGSKRGLHLDTADMRGLPFARPGTNSAGDEQECKSAGIEEGADPGGRFGHLSPRRASGETGLVRSFNDPVRAGTVVRGVGSMRSSPFTVRASVPFARRFGKAEGRPRPGRLVAIGVAVALVVPTMVLAGNDRARRCPDDHLREHRGARHPDRYVRAGEHHSERDRADVLRVRHHLGRLHEPDTDAVRTR